MSEHAPLSTLPLFSPPNPEQKTVDKIHGDMGSGNGRWLELARRGLARLYARDPQPLSTDDLWKLIDRGDVPPLPPEASPNLMGSVFSGSPDWRAVGWVRSGRPGSHGNLLRTWEMGGVR